MKSFLLLFLIAWQAVASCVPPPNTYDYEAQIWQVRIAGNSGALSASSYRTGTTFMQQVRRWGVRPQLGRVNLYLGDNTNAMLMPIIRDWFTTAESTPDDLIAFASGDYSESTGLTGNTTTKYLRPNGAVGINLSSFTTIDNIHEAVYVRTASTEAGYSMGGTSGTATCGMPLGYSGSSYIEFHTANNSVADTNTLGFYIGTRISSSSRTLYKNGTSIVSSSTCAGALGGGAPLVHGFNSAGTPTAFTSRTLSYYAFGYAIPAALVTSYGIAVGNVQRAKARAVVP